MIRFRFLAVLATSLVLIAASSKVVPPVVGQEAANFTLLDQNDRPARLSAARGQKVVIVFYRGYW